MVLVLNFVKAAVLTNPKRFLTTFAKISAQRTKRIPDNWAALSDSPLQRKEIRGVSVVDDTACDISIERICGPKLNVSRTLAKKSQLTESKAFF